ncbi:hypothetical protein ACLMJK_003215 [Lecanora helva]
MLLLTALFTSLLAGFAASQNSTTKLDPNSVDLTTRNQWCLDERANCPLLCGGPNNLKTNQCSGMDLTWDCTCMNGTEPTSIAQYLNTMPNHICQQEFANCRQQNPGSQSCKTCGTLDVKNVPAMTSSTAAASSAAATSGSSSASAASPSSTAASGAGRVEGAVGGLAAGVIAAVLL